MTKQEVDKELKDFILYNENEITELFAQEPQLASALSNLFNAVSSEYGVIETGELFEGLKVAQRKKLILNEGQFGLFYLAFRNIRTLLFVRIEDNDKTDLQQKISYAIGLERDNPKNKSFKVSCLAGSDKFTENYNLTFNQENLKQLGLNDFVRYTSGTEVIVASAMKELKLHPYYERGYLYTRMWGRGVPGQPSNVFSRVQAVGVTGVYLSPRLIQDEDLNDSINTQWLDEMNLLQSTYKGIQESMPGQITDVVQYDEIIGPYPLITPNFLNYFQNMEMISKPRPLFHLYTEEESAYVKVFTQVMNKEPFPVIVKSASLNYAFEGITYRVENLQKSITRAEILNLQPEKPYFDPPRDADQIIEEEEKPIIQPGALVLDYIDNMEEILKDQTLKTFRLQQFGPGLYGKEDKPSFGIGLLNRMAQSSLVVLTNTTEGLVSEIKKENMDFFARRKWEEGGFLELSEEYDKAKDRRILSYDSFPRVLRIGEMVTTQLGPIVHLHGASIMGRPSPTLFLTATDLYDRIERGVYKYYKTAGEVPWFYKGNLRIGQEVMLRPEAIKKAETFFPYFAEDEKLKPTKVVTGFFTQDNGEELVFVVHTPAEEWQQVAYFKPNELVAIGNP